MSFIWCYIFNYGSWAKENILFSCVYVRSFDLSVIEVLTSWLQWGSQDVGRTVSISGIIYKRLPRSICGSHSTEIFGQIREKAGLHINPQYDALLIQSPASWIYQQSITFISSDCGKMILRNEVLIVPLSKLNNITRQRKNTLYQSRVLVMYSFECQSPFSRRRGPWWGLIFLHGHSKHYNQAY